MNDMKKLLGAVGSFLILYVILSAAFAPADESALAASVVVAPSERSAMFTAREEDDRIVIYAGDELLTRTENRVSHLPKIDRLRLHEGIKLYSEKELKRFMEDYCS